MSGVFCFCSLAGPARWLLYLRSPDSCCFLVLRSIFRRRGVHTMSGAVASELSSSNSPLQGTAGRALWFDSRATGQERRTIRDRQGRLAAPIALARPWPGTAALCVGLISKRHALDNAHPKSRCGRGIRFHRVYARRSSPNSCIQHIPRVGCQSRACRQADLHQRRATRRGSAYSWRWGGSFACVTRLSGSGRLHAERICLFLFAQTASP